MAIQQGPSAIPNPVPNSRPRIRVPSAPTQAERDFQTVGKHERLVAENLCGLSVCTHATAIEHNHSTAQTGYQIQVMCCDDAGSWKIGNDAHQLSS
jgi:hypothetical protein